jgi:hypothetical protein
MRGEKCMRDATEFRAMMTGICWIRVLVDQMRIVSAEMSCRREKNEKENSREHWRAGRYRYLSSAGQGRMQKMSGRE